LLAAVVALALLVAAVVVLLRRRTPALDLRKLDAAEALRYLEAFTTAERDFESRPQVATAQARGIVEEVMRRMGFPDRLDAAQKAIDLAAHDRAAAAALASADGALREGDGRESLRRALMGYREVLNRMLQESVST